MTQEKTGIAYGSLIDAIVSDLKHDEGLDLFPYKDGFGNWTIGYGRNLSANGISVEEAIYLFQHDIQTAADDVVALVPDIEEHPESVMRALINMAFNMGRSRLSEFKLMLAALKARDYATAAAEALNSKWARQVGNRAQRVANLIRSAA